MLGATLGVSCILLLVNFGLNPGVDPKFVNTGLFSVFWEM